MHYSQPLTREQLEALLDRSDMMPGAAAPTEAAKLVRLASLNQPKEAAEAADKATFKIIEHNNETAVPIG